METAAFLYDFYSNLDVLALMFTRFIGFLMLMPVLSGQYVISRAKITLAVFMAILVMTATAGTLPELSYPDSVPGFIGLIMGEAAVGLMQGFIVYTLFSIFLIAGQLIDFQIGFSMVSVFDPVSQIQIPITGNLYYLVATVFFVQLGGLRSLIHTICESYEVIPPGQAFILQNSNLAGLFIDVLSESIIQGVTIALPIMGAILLIDVALGLLVKAVPQMNIFVVGMPIKLLIGLLVLFAITPQFSDYYDLVYDLTGGFTRDLFTILKRVVE